VQAHGLVHFAALAAYGGALSVPSSVNLSESVIDMGI
jgi:hypothetical protein